ncbi:hypothetical protein POM88_052380 [Heracleum sosnowskyi]|uniref:Uncharacterized protein n=1 Tax=Heracleum sosnowskyi TaxID=360622 RepID=A0AAD8GS85_9APIA|nr:hypothetical protein POM88_052380 [Heracleum sosnowskyi]
MFENNIQVAGVPEVTESLFLARQAALKKNKSNEGPMLYSCGLRGKGYRSSKANEKDYESEESDVEVDGEEESVADMDVNDEDSDGNEDDNMLVDVDRSCCFMCDLKHKTVERCMVHMHKQHGFFIADVENSSLEAVRKHMVRKNLWLTWMSMMKTLMAMKMIICWLMWIDLVALCAI